MIEPLMPVRNVPKDGVHSFGTTDPTPQPVTICTTCYCGAIFYSDTSSNQFAIQVNNGG